MSLLQVSVIEGRNLAVEAGGGDPFVKLKLGDQESQTSSVKGLVTAAGQMHKWLKDFKLAMDDAGGTLLVTVSQDKRTIGSISIPVGSVSDAGTQVQWFKVKSAEDKTMGEICLVLRAVNKTPSTAQRASAARVVRPVAASPRSPRVEGPAAATPASPRSPRRSSLDAAHKRQAAQAATASPKPGGTGTGTPKAATPSGTPNRSPLRARPATANSTNATTPKPFKGGSRAKRSSVSGGKGGSGIFEKLPIVGSVLAAIALAGVMTMKPKYYEVQEGDTMCAVGFCFNRNYRDILKKNPQVVDPDRIYPGQRLRID